MKYAIGFAYLLIGLLFAWSIWDGNYEFIFYGVTALGIVVFIHLIDRTVDFKEWVLWLFNIWLIGHIAGGLVVINGVYLYSYILIPLVGEPYLIFKYDQLVHWYCYLVVALLIYSIAIKYLQTSSRAVLIGLVVLAAIGIGGLNEIIEFLATVFIEDVNVGGYENTAIDIVSNMLGALTAIPLFAYIHKD
ncbi:MAG: DUF2238 domain-containing protein [Patescibacteria group bacterium]